MNPNVSAVERAFELAKSGQLATVGEIKQALSREGYPSHQITGPMLLRQLRQIIVANR